MDQQSLEALLMELRGLDPVPTQTRDEDDDELEDGAIAENPANKDGSTSSASDTAAAPAASDYTAWYEDYVKSTVPAISPPTVNDTAAIPPLSIPHAPSQDLRKLTYAQALPIISRLAGDEKFLEALQELKSSQETFELSLLDERNRTKAELERQLRKAREAAAASGTQYEVERISKLLNATMHKFDKGALIRWDSLMKDQQARLEQLGVPCFYVLKNPDPVAQERQRRVMETLTTLLSEI